MITTERVDVKTKAEAEKAIKAGHNINIIAGAFALSLVDFSGSVWITASSPSIETWGTSSPSIVTWGTSSPSIETWGTSSPRIETWGTSSPSIETWGTSSPSIVTRETSSPSIVTWGTSSPRCSAEASVRGELRYVRSDFFMILAYGHKEVPQLVSALREGRVDGSTYSGKCACLVGTLEKAGATSIPHEPRSPAELWFVPIVEGTKPGDEGEGGFRSAKALEWALEYCAATGIELPTIGA